MVTGVEESVPYSLRYCKQTRVLVTTAIYGLICMVSNYVSHIVEDQHV